MKKGEQANETAKNEKKIPKWKQDSMAFQAIMKQNKGAKLSQEEQLAIDSGHKDSLIKCQYCGRSFNEQAAQKHTVICERNHKKSQMRKK